MSPHWSNRKKVLKMSQEKKSKITFESVIICPHCSKEVIVKQIRKTISKPIKGEYNDETIVEKNLQKDLDDYAE